MIPEFKLGKGKLELTDNLNYKDMKNTNSLWAFNPKIIIGYKTNILNKKNFQFHAIYTGELRYFTEEEKYGNTNHIKFGTNDANKDTLHKILVSIQYSF
jgi:hypothetical protein